MSGLLDGLTVIEMPGGAIDYVGEIVDERCHDRLLRVRRALELGTNTSGRFLRLPPEVVGGIVVRVGDEVIDGSVASKLETARRTVGV